MHGDKCVAGCYGGQQMWGPRKPPLITIIQTYNNDDNNNNNNDNNNDNTNNHNNHNNHNKQPHPRPKDWLRLTKQYNVLIRYMIRYFRF